MMGQLKQFIAIALCLIISQASGDHNVPIKDTSNSFGHIFQDDTLRIVSREHLTLESSRHDGSLALTGTLGMKQTSNPTRCVSKCEDICLEWENTKLTITKDEECTVVVWTKSVVDDNVVELEDCFDLADSNWFGGPEDFYQYWPFEKMNYTEYSYVTKSLNNQGIAEPYWVNSKGAYIHVHKGVPLFIDQHNHKQNGLCLIAKNDIPYPSNFKQFELKYQICQLSNAREAHEHAIRNVLGKPSGVPDDVMIRHPIWSTWARYKVDVDEKTVLEFGDQIIEHGFNNSQLEIDDLWEPCYGAFVFDLKKFPDIKNLTNVLKGKGFRVTLWVHPFINTNCEPYHSEALGKGYFVKNTRNETTTKWWNGEAGAIDFTNTDAIDWWVARINQMLNESGIDSLKFDAGETSWLPQPPVLHAPIDQNPNIYTTRYVETVTQFGPMIEVRVGQNSQDLPIFVRMLDKDSKWDWNNGLKTLVTTLLQMNMVGYPLVLPDMIGGNAYGDVVTKELFIRWLQANTFMPSLQFSFVPWDYDNETIEISRKYTDLHVKYTDLILELAKKASEDGTPINPPIWWVDPEDSVSLKIDNEFLLGENLLVAPVLDKGATSRDIYLPRGLWRDELRPNQPLIEGRTWLRNYSAPLADLPYFTRVSS